MNSKERFEKTLSSLNDTQRESVLSNVNTLQILAGPGSGKTRGWKKFAFVVCHVFSIFLPSLQLRSAHLPGCLLCRVKRNRTETNNRCDVHK